MASLDSRRIYCSKGEGRDYKRGMSVSNGNSLMMKVFMKRKEHIPFDCT